MGPFDTSSDNTSSWYNDCAYFINDSYPWFVRGGRINAAPGLLSFRNSTGSANSYTGFRLVLAP